MKKRSKINVYKLVALIAIVFAISSCSDSFFDEKAGERITPDQHYKSVIDAEISVFGALRPLSEIMPQMIMLDGLRSDQMVYNSNSSSSDPYLEAINSQVFTLDNPYIDASAYYKVIINCNEVLANIDKVNELDRTFTPFLLNSFKGALYTLRGWSYLTLVNLYGEAAWIDGTYTSLPVGMKQTFIPKEAMIDTLINQLTKYVFDPSVGKTFIEYDFNPLMNTKAVLGELYLEKNDYVNAAKYLKLACESYLNEKDVFKVDATYEKEAWKFIFINSDGKYTENMSLVSYNLYENQLNPLPKWLKGSDMYLAKPAQSLVDSFKVQTQSNKNPGDLYRGQGITYDTTATGEPYISKYSLDLGQEFSTDIIITRATDLHLKLAEALNRSNDPTTALILLNAGFSTEKTKPSAYSKWSDNKGVRGRAYLTSKVVPDSIDAISGSDTTRVKLEGEARTEYIEDLIMNERAMELAFEGHRWFDLVRVANRRNDASYLADKVAVKFGKGTSKYDEIHAKLMNKNNWYLPLNK